MAGTATTSEAASGAWEDRGAQTREGLRPLYFLIGSWSGAGHSQGEPVQAHLRAALCFEETVLEVRERLTDAQGALCYEDVTFYRFDPTARQIKVLQISAPAWTSEQIVQPEPWGLRWYAGPFAPQVRIRQEGEDTLLEAVFEPDADAPVVAIRYQRAGAP